MKKIKMYDEIVNLYNSNIAYKEIAISLGLSRSIVEKVIRLYKLRQKLKSSVTAANYNKVVDMNFKALKLNRLLKADVDLNYLLEKVPANCTEEVLQKLISNFNVEGKFHTYDNTNNIKEALSTLESRENELEKELEDLQTYEYKVYDSIEASVGDVILKENLLTTILYNRNLKKWFLHGKPSIKTKLLFTLSNIESRNHQSISMPYLINNIEQYIQFISAKNIYIIPCKDLISKEYYSYKCYLMNKKLVNEILAEKSTLSNKYKSISAIDEVAVAEIKNDIRISRTKLLGKAAAFFHDKGYVGIQDYRVNKLNCNVDLVAVNVDKEDILFGMIFNTVSDFNLNFIKYSLMMNCNKLFIITADSNLYNIALAYGGFNILYFKEIEDSIEVHEGVYNTGTLLNYKEILKAILEKLYCREHKIG